LLLLLLLLTACAAPATAPPPQPTAAPAPTAVAEPFPGAAATAERIVTTALQSRGAFAQLTALCDGHGHRISGSKALEGAIDWALATMKAHGADQVRREDVVVPRWIRGAESVVLHTPEAGGYPGGPMAMLGLGDSVGTPPEGITADVVTVHDEAGLERLGRAGIAGKIVHFDNPMPPWTSEHGACYGHTVRFRLKGARIAAAKGAVAVLVRSVTARSLRSPHTGMLYYGDANPKIPAAALSTEDSALLTRLQAAGHTPRVTLKMAARTDGTVKSANAIAEIRGREAPDEVVLISGHIDSWDVGQGAHDDGAGVVMAMETIRVLKQLGLRPRRTIRAVLWTNEENGMAGVKSYIRAHSEGPEADLQRHVAAIEADAGGFAPEAFGVAHKDAATQARAVARLKALMPLLAKAGAIKVKPGASAPDVGRMTKHGVTTLGLFTHSEHYFDYHHTEADTLDKVDPTELQRDAAAMAALAWLLAEMPGTLAGP
jgi:Zn-dependent M28 family amino/carboxypeptidase